MEADAISRDNLSIFFPGTQGKQASKSDTRNSSGLGDQTANGLVISRLVLVVQDLFKAGIAPSTRKVYGTGSNRYLNFCTMTKLTLYPALENFVGFRDNEVLLCCS